MAPYKIFMLILLLAMEIPAAIILVVSWVKDCRQAKEMEDTDNG